MRNFEEFGRDAPSLDTLEAMAFAAFNALPETLRLPLGPLTVHVMEEADPDMLAAVDLSDPLELTGLYVGVPLIAAIVSDPNPEPGRVYLFRRALLAEWRENPALSLTALVEHVLIHEIAHHYGYSDEEIDAILDAES